MKKIWVVLIGVTLFCGGCTMWGSRLGLGVAENPANHRLVKATLSRTNLAPNVVIRGAISSFQPEIEKEGNAQFNMQNVDVVGLVNALNNFNGSGGAMDTLDRALQKNKDSDLFVGFFENSTDAKDAAISFDLAKLQAGARREMIDFMLKLQNEKAEMIIQTQAVTRIEYHPVYVTNTAGVVRPVPSPPDVAKDKTPSEDTAGKGLPVLPDTSGSPVFLWKPVSDSDGKLVVLIPAKYNGQIEKVAVNGKPLRFHDAKGKNGNRSHWRASRPGATFGNDITVSAHLKNGSTKSWHVPNGGERKEI